MATQADVDAIVVRLKDLKTAVDALPVQPVIDTTALAQATTDLEAAVAAKTTPPA